MQVFLRIAGCVVLVLMILVESFFVLVATGDDSYLPVPASDLRYDRADLAPYTGPPLRISRSWTHDYFTGFFRSTLTILVCWYACGCLWKERERPTVR